MPGKAKAGPPPPPPKPYQFNVDDFQIETGQKVLRWNPSRDPVDPICTQEYHIRLSVGKDPVSNKPQYDINYWKPKYIDQKAKFEPPPLPTLPPPTPAPKAVKKKKKPSARTNVKKTKKTTTVAHLKMSPDIGITVWRLGDAQDHVLDMNPHVVNRPDNIMHASNASQDWNENLQYLDSGNHSNDSWKPRTICSENSNHSNDSWKPSTIFSGNSTINVSYQENPKITSGKLPQASHSSQIVGCKNISGSWVTLTNSTDVEREIDVTDFDETKPEHIRQSPARSKPTKDEPTLRLNQMCQTSLKFDCATLPQFVIDNDWASDVSNTYS